MPAERAMSYRAYLQNDVLQEMRETGVVSIQIQKNCVNHMDHHA